MEFFYAGIGLGYFAAILILLTYFGIKFYTENGYYLPLTSRFAMRRYLFPADQSLCLKLAEDMTRICKGCLDGDLLPYPFFKGDAYSLRNRVICFIYDRKNIRQGPIAFHASFLTRCDEKPIYHIGLVMVLPEYRRMGIQFLGIWNAGLYFIFHATNCIATEITSSSSYLSVMEKSQYDYYPDWRSPEKSPKSWQIDIAKFMVETYPHEMAVSRLATLDKETLVVRGSNQKDGDGAYQLICTNESRKSKDLEKQSFMDNRVDNENGDEQFFVGRPSFMKGIKSVLR